MKTNGKTSKLTPFLWCLSILFLSATVHPALGIPAAWVVAAGQVALLPLLLCLGYSCFPNQERSLLVRAIALELVVAIPIHLFLLYLQMTARWLADIPSPDNSQLPYYLHVLGVLQEEFTKMVPTVILYRRLAAVSNDTAALAVGFFSGLTFGCFESIVTSSGYQLVGSGDVLRSMWIVFERILFFPVIVHASLTAVAAFTFMRVARHRHVVAGLLRALTVSSGLHYAVNAFTGYRIILGLFIVVLLSALNWFANDRDTN